MNAANPPPAIPGLLLKWFLPHNIALAGDLEEEHRRRESIVWYSGQVLAAIALHLGSEVRAHKLLAIRALATGWAALWLLSFLEAEINRFMSGWVLDRLIVIFWTHPFPMMWATQLWNRPAMALSFVLSGWVVGRLHRNHRPAMVLLFTVTILGWTVYQDAARLINPRNTPVPYPWLDVMFTPLPLLILFGGLWRSAADRRLECSI